MVKKYNKVFITGDMHLGDVVFDYEEKLVEALKQDNFDAIIFGGDTFDPWRGLSSKDLVDRYSELFKFLQKFKDKVTFIKGNHDPDIDFLKKLGFSVKKKIKYVGSLGEKIKVVHGHEFDSVCRRWEFFTKKVVHFENKINQYLTKLDRDLFVRFVNLINNNEISRLLVNFQKQINKQRNIDALIFGHTHLPMVNDGGKVKYYNWGGWQKDFSLNPHYLVHAEGVIKSVDVK